MNIVWFKRDLRESDHQALYAALSSGPTVGLFIFEPEWFLSPYFHSNHLLFLIECLEELRAQLKNRGVDLIIRNGNAEEVFAQLRKQGPLTAIYSHEETGVFWTFQRDRRIKKWCKENSVPWVEFRQFGVIRGLKNRDHWNKMRSKIIERPLVPSQSQAPVVCPWGSEQFPKEKINPLEVKTLVPRGGRREAEKIMQTFFSVRSANYLKGLSSPNSAYESCSRLSPYLSWGVLSMTEVHHWLLSKKRSLEGEVSPRAFSWKRSLEHFENRLWWHCHFIQKLESEPEIEWQNVNSELDGMREAEFCEKKFQAWCEGRTGFPFIDACMRALLKHGWINFRMRAMLVSFASYQLWLHWKKPAEFLARHFIDFEPGIHFSQMQMQSGVTGINAIRIYSPTKQQMDQDPHGIFVHQHVPELAGLSGADLVEPWAIPPLMKLAQGSSDFMDYPSPIVNPIDSYNKAKERIFNWRKKNSVRQESLRVLEKHGSRDHKRFPKQKRGLTT